MDNETIDLNEEILKPKRTPLWIYIALFTASFITCLSAGAAWAGQNPYEITNWQYGLTYTLLILGFLSAHEFGHYIAARLHDVDATLPFYIPFPFGFLFGAEYAINFGTLGAVIRTRSPIPSRKALFDIGVAGPIAGFVVCVIFLIWGMTHLPSMDSIYAIHPEYLTLHNGAIPDKGLVFGDTVFYHLLAGLIVPKGAWLPPMNEMYHYPFLNVGWFGLFVTTLNMLPMGQLDGGHVIYSMFGRRIHNIVAKVVWYVLMVIGCFALLAVIRELLMADLADNFLITLRQYLFSPLDWLYKNTFLLKGWTGWLLWALIARFVIKLRHPPVYNNSEIGSFRMFIGWIAILILLLSFSFNGIYILE